MQNDRLTGIVFGLLVFAFGLWMAYVASRGSEPSRDFRIWQLFVSSRTPDGEKNYRTVGFGIIFAIGGIYIILKNVIFG